MTVVWPIEDIPNEDALYMRVHRQWFRDSHVVPGSFRNRPDDATGGMSTDWNRYATPGDTLQRARRPEDNAVIRFAVGDIRAIPEQQVEHAPLPDNRAHTDVLGPKEQDPEIRRLFSRKYSLVISLERDA